MSQSVMLRRRSGAVAIWQGADAEARERWVLEVDDTDSMFHAAEPPPTIVLDPVETYELLAVILRGPPGPAGPMGPAGISG